jgi:hypothetical protein
MSKKRPPPVSDGCDALGELEALVSTLHLFGDILQDDCKKLAAALAQPAAELRSAPGRAATPGESGRKEVVRKYKEKWLLGGAGSLLGRIAERIECMRNDRQCEGPQWEKLLGLVHDALKVIELIGEEGRDAYGPGESGRERQ